MTEPEIDLFAVTRGTVTAPAGCGKTHLIAETLKRHTGAKPILILTHTNAGVVALRARLDKAGVPTKAYRLSTIDGWAIRMVGLFPTRTGIDPATLQLNEVRPNYPKVREAAWRLLKGGHVLDLLRATYERVIVDEYQDCSIDQHAIVYHAAPALPVCVLGDPMQAIFGWQGNELADWDKHVCSHFPVVGELATPWRWRLAGTEDLGVWLLDARRRLEAGLSVDLTTAPCEVSWVELDGTEDRLRQLRAAQTRAVTEKGSVLIIGDGRSPPNQQLFASQIPEAVTVEAVDLRDMVTFARTLDFNAPNALQLVVEFAGSVMTNVGGPDLLRRIGVLERGAKRREASELETLALAFKAGPSPASAATLLAAIGQEGGARAHRPAVLRACMKALNACDGSAGNSFHEAALAAREQNRLVGRPLPKRAVGSTLLLKGLEADVSVILDASVLDAKNLYVAMTRGAHRLVVCSAESTLL
ncbi:UvrD-helicase domain-containing protein [Novispirillum itersonii]|uniref:UvrD-helicase domain-containing protein n=1 Tax=Novispirillum itersonii TaxID=189 RepID=UPI00037A8A43|nr:UvrD-helicase domain-containing protein [Novispirillum itersonii]